MQKQSHNGGIQHPLWFHCTPKLVMLFETLMIDSAPPLLNDQCEYQPQQPSLVLATSNVDDNDGHLDPHHDERCHAPNTFGTVNMEHTINLRLSWSE